MFNKRNQGVNTSDIIAGSEKRPVPQEQLQREVDYIRAQQMLDSALKDGLISLSEFNKITALNRQSFSPALAQIMPETR